MEALTRCMECHYAAKDPATDNVAVPIIGAVQQKLCLRYPPSASMLPAQKGMVSITMYPVVNGSTFSCSEFEKEVH